MIEAPMPFILGLLKSHVKHVNSMNEDGSFNSEYEDEELFQERLVVMINDENKSVELSKDKIDLPIPSFKNLLNELIEPFSILNSSSSYVYNPTEKQK